MKKYLIFLFVLNISYSQQGELVWNSFPSININRAFHSMAVACGKIYIIGGSTGGKNEFMDTSSVEMYEPQINQWIYKTSMPEAITTSCAVSINDKIYVVGGQQNTFKNRTAKVLMYDCALDKWEYKSSMNIARAFHSLAALNNKLYAIGGREKTEEINSKQKDSLAVYTIEEYDIKNDKWIIKKVLPFKHFSIGAVTIKDKIYILSDTTDNNMLDKSAILEEYDPVKNTLTLKAALTPSKCDVGIAAYKNKVYVLGGWYKNSLSTVEEYDAANDKWEEKTGMPYKVQNLQAVTLDNKIYVSGGIIYKSGGNEKKDDVFVYYPERD